MSDSSAQIYVEIMSIFGIKKKEQNSGTYHSVADLWAYYVKGKEDWKKNEQIQKEGTDIRSLE